MHTDIIYAYRYLLARSSYTDCRVFKLERTPPGPVRGNSRNPQTHCGLRTYVRTGRQVVNYGSKSETRIRERGSGSTDEEKKVRRQRVRKGVTPGNSSLAN